MMATNSARRLHSILDITLTQFSIWAVRDHERREPNTISVLLYLLFQAQYQWREFLQVSVSGQSLYQLAVRRIDSTSPSPSKPSRDMRNTVPLQKSTDQRSIEWHIVACTFSSIFRVLALSCCPLSICNGQGCMFSLLILAGGYPSCRHACTYRLTLLRLLYRGSETRIVPGIWD